MIIYIRSPESDQSITVFPEGALNPVDTLSSTNARAVIGDDTRVVDFSKSGVVKINFTASNGESYWGTGFVVDEHTIATAAHCVCTGSAEVYADAKTVT